MNKYVERGIYTLTAGGVAAAILIPGGGESSSATSTHQPEPRSAFEFPDKVSCRAVAPAAWVPTPGWIRRLSVAAQLGVSLLQVEKGQTGPARCDTPISPLYVHRGEGVPVTVTGIEDGDNCLAIGLDFGEYPPQLDHAYRGILAVCAGPPRTFGREA